MCHVRVSFHCLLIFALVSDDNDDASSSISEGGNPKLMNLTVRGNESYWKYMLNLIKHKGIKRCIEELSYTKPADILGQLLKDSVDGFLS